MKTAVLLALVANPTSLHGADMTGKHAELFTRAENLGMPSDAILLVIRLDQQQMDVITRKALITTYPVSTSRLGVGNREGSFRTPPGYHEVVERYGNGAPPGQVFKSRQPDERVIPPEAWSRSTDEDLVLTRILRLKGREPGINAGPGIDSYDRCIYIHGTNEEHLLGTPASHGCIRMANRPLIDLFNLSLDRAVWCTMIKSEA